MNQKWKSPIEGRESLGFKFWSGTPGVMNRLHFHSDIELNFVLSGEIEYFFGGRFEVLKADDLAVFWAGMPHVLTRSSPGSQMVWGVVPLPWFLQWALPIEFTQALFEGNMLWYPGRDPRERDKFVQWSRDFNQPTLDLNKIVALEVEATLRRLVIEGKHGNANGRSTPLAGAAHQQIEKLTSFIARNYLEELTIQEIAQHLNLHPNYAMQLFRERCGLSLWDYVLRLRVSHAQGLLLSTDRKIGDIARQSGFASESRFYAAFEKYCGLPPRAWRGVVRNEGQHEATPLVEVKPTSK